MLPSALDLPHKTPRAGRLAKLTHQTLAITSDIPHRPATNNRLQPPAADGRPRRRNLDGRLAGPADS